MKVLRSLIFALLFLSFAGKIHSQDRFTPFFGSIHFGSGVCTVIDFKLDNNAVHLPIQFGINTHKYIDANSYFEVGISYAERGYKKTICTSGPNWKACEGFVIWLRSFDIPVNYFRLIPINLNFDMYYSIGMINSLNLIEPMLRFTEYQNDLPENIIRQYYISPQFGLHIYPRSNIRIGITCDLSCLPLIKQEYKSEFKSEVDYFGATIYPIEAILSIDYIIN